MAILNVLKWAGLRVTMRNHYRYLARLCKAGRRDDGEYHGTTISGFRQALRKINQTRHAKTGRAANLKIKELRTVARETSSFDLHWRVGIEGSVAVVFHKTEHGRRHFSLIVNSRLHKGDMTYEVVNLDHGKTKSTINRSELIQWLSSRDARVWVISRR